MQFKQGASFFYDDKWIVLVISFARLPTIRSGDDVIRWRRPVDDAHTHDTNLVFSFLFLCLLKLLLTF